MKEEFFPFCGSTDIENMGLIGFNTMEYGCHSCHRLWDVNSSFNIIDVGAFLDKISKEGDL